MISDIFIFGNAQMRTSVNGDVLRHTRGPTGFTEQSDHLLKFPHLGRLRLRSWSRTSTKWKDGSSIPGSSNLHVEVHYITKPTVFTHPFKILEFRCFNHFHFQQSQTLKTSNLHVAFILGGGDVRCLNAN